jgi:predicted RNA-binding Zn-ribbon protein involved in translation (DUF1610 family)
METSAEGKCTRCGNQAADLHVESCLLKVPAILPVQATRVVAAPVKVQTNADATGATKSCPVCGQTIKTEARICRFCKATFTVKIRGYCLTDHEVMEATAEGKCLRCNNEVTDLHMESSLLKAPAVLPIQATQAAVVTVKEQTRTGTTGATKPCPTCGQVIKAEARICRFCHSKLG